jgi:hypothetical protein
MTLISPFPQFLRKRPPKWGDSAENFPQKFLFGGKILGAGKILPIERAKQHQKAGAGAGLSVP